MRNCFTPASAGFRPKPIQSKFSLSNPKKFWRASGTVPYQRHRCPAILFRLFAFLRYIHYVLPIADHEAISGLRELVRHTPTGRRNCRRSNSRHIAFSRDSVLSLYRAKSVSPTRWSRPVENIHQPNRPPVNSSYRITIM